MLANSDLATEELTRSRVMHQIDQRERLLERIGDERLSTLSRLMGRIGTFRDKNKAKLGETVARRFQILDAISNRTGEARANLDFYLVSEIVTLLDVDTRVEESILRAREINGVHFERSEDLREGILIPAQTVSQNDSRFILEGMCASEGEVEGIVRVISQKEDIVKMGVGDIMVSKGTDFDLIEIMNLSSGVVTEEGGLLSHAAVICRELMKPCLIGARDATTLLRDGDRVKLDATNGILEVVSTL